MRFRTKRNHSMYLNTNYAPGTPYHKKNVNNLWNWFPRFKREGCRKSVFIATNAVGHLLMNTSYHIPPPLPVLIWMLSTRNICNATNTVATLLVNVYHSSRQEFSIAPTVLKDRCDLRLSTRSVCKAIYTVKTLFVNASYDSQRKANRLESAPALSAPTVVLDQYNRRLPQEMGSMYPAKLDQYLRR